MISNIKNDFAIEINTSFQFVQEELERANIELKHFGNIFRNQEENLKELQSKNEKLTEEINSTIKELVERGIPIPKALNIPLIQLIELKLRMGLELTSDETSHLLETKFGKE